ncbi:hypothetical protein LINPERHAP1_LOCUS20173 [Linum perenne]
METIVGLPKLVALRANNNFMHYVGDQNDAVSKPYSQCVGCKKQSNKTLNAVKLEVIQSKYENSLVHIKCSSNGKYLRSDRINGTHWIAATAEEPEEDPTKDTCTLFKPMYSRTTSFSGAATIKLLHVYSKRYLTHSGDRTEFEVYPWGTPATAETVVGLESEDRLGIVS